MSSDRWGVGVTDCDASVRANGRVARPPAHTLIQATFSCRSLSSSGLYSDRLRAFTCARRQPLMQSTVRQRWKQVRRS